MAEDKGDYGIRARYQDGTEDWVITGYSWDRCVADAAWLADRHHEVAYTVTALAAPAQAERGGA